MQSTDGALAPASGGAGSRSLTKQESQQLRNCEAVIERGEKTFVEVGNALSQIRDDRLYGETHDTFEEYCRGRWLISVPHASRLIGAARVTDHLKTLHARNVPGSIRQVEPLLSLRSDDGGKGTKRTIDLKKVEEVWEEVVKQAPKAEDGAPHITGNHVRAVVNKSLGKERGVNQQTPAPDDWKSKSIKRATLNKLAAMVDEIAEIAGKSTMEVSIADLRRKVNALQKYVQRIHKGATACSSKQAVST